MPALLLLALAASPVAPPVAHLDAAMLVQGDVAPECHLDSTQPIAPGSGAVELSEAVGAVEQVVTCNGDVGVVDYFDVGQRADDGVKELEQARWGGPQPPARLHDGLLRRNAVLADVSGSRAIVFLLQTKLQARDFHSLGGGADFGEIAQGMAEDRKAGGSDRVDWMSYQDGLREAVTSHRPVMLYFSTTWCPHCRNFERVLKDPRVVEQSRSFVMVKLDDQKDDELARKFSPDGRYFPRTLFLSPDGELDASLTNGSRRHRYTNSESDPDHLLRWMKRALAKLAP